jgi:hypothetical protein
MQLKEQFNKEIGEIGKAIVRDKEKAWRHVKLANGEHALIASTSGLAHIKIRIQEPTDEY